ncbi:hypothetical protein VHEMI01530 [[Torrubiella] hemipterigena]|uniref:Uncharacterized protein n=1 Tax=[Torrubiella] hemipterigena TaxID=1531966 RepID=A0A0A1T7R3_9HYPO|nr:hypothetical protein VHEMI01530 [[Torrubiella] hemipterigena]
MASPQPITSSSAMPGAQQTSAPSQTASSFFTEIKSVKPPPLTTQLTMAESCSLRFVRLNVTTSTMTQLGPDIFYSRGNGYYSTHTQTHTWTEFISDTAAPFFSSCQASGWDIDKMTFSPGLCPSGWTYHYMSAYTDYYKPEPPTSTAICCAPSFDPTQMSPYTASTCVSFSSDYYEGHSSLFYHTPYVVQWQQTDLSKMAISLPDLDHNRHVTTWVPGRTLEAWEGYLDRPDIGEMSVSLILLILLPILGFFIILGIIIWCALHSRKKRKLENAKHELAELSPVTDAASQQSLEAGSESRASDAQAAPVAETSSTASATAAASASATAASTTAASTTAASTTAAPDVPVPLAAGPESRASDAQAAPAEGTNGAASATAADDPTDASTSTTTAAPDVAVPTTVAAADAASTPTAEPHPPPTTSTPTPI